MHRKIFIHLLLSAMLSLFSTLAFATDMQSLASIQLVAEQHLRTLLQADGSTLYIKADDLDNRLRLAPCPAQLEAFLPSGANIGRRVTTGVRCNQGQQWTVYLPVNVQSEGPALVLNKALARNALVSAADVELRVLRTPGVGSSSLKTLNELAGKRLKRDLATGTVLVPGMFEPELLIHRGQRVTLLARVAGIEVRSQGIALSDGVASSRIYIKNINSAKVVEGLVDTNSVVRVEL